MLQSSRAADPILVLTTGGTIDKQYFDALSRYQVTETVIGKMLEIAGVTYPYRIEEVLRRDSIDMTDEDRATILQRARADVARRVVVTHGTDTMALTARALTEVKDKTIVLTGALAPARFSESDAAFNLGMAFATVQTAPRGVYIVMNGTVFAGEVTKRDGRFFPVSA